MRYVAQTALSSWVNPESNTQQKRVNTNLWNINLGLQAALTVRSKSANIAEFKACSDPHAQGDPLTHAPGSRNSRR